jgi:beta-phosphoglucomutase-like phosphatase (HAD superfamily)
VGVKRLLTEAHHRGIKLAIASTASVDNVNALLENSLDGEMSKFFSVIAAGDMVEKKKPAPDIYLLALEQLGLSAQECLAIEDTNQGLIASTTAGLTTVITVNEYTQNQNFAWASLVLNHLGEIDNPFTVIQGNSNNYHYFNLDLAEQLLIDIDDAL